MAKRGETFPWRLTYTWPGGMKGTTNYRTESDAEYAARRQRAVVGPNGETCTVTVAERISR